MRKIQPKLASGKLDKDFEVPALEPLALERYVSRLLVHVSQMIGLTAMICAHLWNGINAKHWIYRRQSDSDAELMENKNWLSSESDLESPKKIA